MAEGSQEYITQGNLKAPPRRKIIEWILEAWKNVRIDVIKSSFTSCALNIAIDGNEDELIHCFKENQPCSAGLQRLKVMANTIDDEREDPFASLSDSDAEQEAINELRRISSLRRNHSQRIRKYSLARGTVSCHRMGSTI